MKSKLEFTQQLTPEEVEDFAQLVQQRAAPQPHNGKQLLEAAPVRRVLYQFHLCLLL